MRAFIVPSVLVFGLALSTAACGDAEPVAAPVAQASQAIIGGAKDTAAFNAVVDLEVNNEGFCSGTVFKIENGVSWILTAAHCIPVTAVYVGLDIGQSMQSYPVADSKKDTRWDGDSFGGLPYDLGVVKVNQTISGITPIPLTEAADGLAVNQSVVSHGYGTTQGYNQGEASYRKVITRTISQLDSSYIVYDQGDETGICSGDSGGPVIANGKVVGVHSTVGNQDPNGEACFGQASSIRVSSRFDFINAVVNGTALPEKGACEVCVDDAQDGNTCRTKTQHCLQSDAECAALAECLQNGGDPNTCTSQHPEGVGPYLDVVECGCADACATECANDTTTCQGVAKCGVAFTGTKGTTLTKCLEENCCDETDAAAADGEAYVCLSATTAKASCNDNAAYAAYAACKAAHCDTKSSSSSSSSSSSGSTPGDDDDDTTGDDDATGDDDDDSTGTKKKASSDGGGCSTAPDGASPLGGLGLALGVALCLGRRRRAA